jgi:hypothetical protein
MNYRPTVDNAAAVAVLDEAHIGQTHGGVFRAARVQRWERRSRTPNLLQLGCLAVAAGIVGLLGKDGAVLFTKLLETADRVHDLGEMARSRSAISQSEAASQTPNQNFSPLLEVLGVVVALL